MIDNLIIVENINFFLVFLGGILSFFSPCIIPLLPVYISYLAGTEKDGVINRKKLLINTLFFMLGISLSFFILGFSFTILGNFFTRYKDIFIKIGGIFIILLGLFQLEIIKIPFFQSEKRINLQPKNMNFFTAFLTGFAFSFGWTPCIGPILSSVLILAATTKSNLLSFTLIGIYSLGFLIPFLLLGIFTNEILKFLKSKQNLLKYTVKIGGVILIIMGTILLSGIMNFDNFTSSENRTSVANSSSAGQEIKAFDFELKDQYGKIHKLSDYRGKVVFLNFWATWCPPCKMEMPHIEKLYSEYNFNKDDVVILGVANPRTDKNPYTKEKDENGIKEFLKENNYTFPTLFDSTGEVFYNYYINAFPTTFMINKEGNIFGYIPGALDKESMIKIIEMTKEK